MELKEPRARVARFRNVPCRLEGKSVCTVEITNLLVTVRPKGARRAFVVTLAEAAAMVAYRAAKQDLAVTQGAGRRGRR